MQPQPPMAPRIQTLVRRYNGSAAYQREAAQLALDGWRVVNVTYQQPNAGCVRGCLLGLFALVWKPQPYLLVTYQWAPTI